HERLRASRLEPALVFAQDQLEDGRTPVARHLRRKSQDDVDELTVEEQKAVHVARYLTFDQEPGVEARGAQDRARELHLASHAGRNGCAAPAAVGGLDDERGTAGSARLGHEPKRRLEAGVAELDVLRDADTTGRQEPVDD